MSSGEESNREEDLGIVNMENANRITETFGPKRGKGKNNSGRIRKSVVEEIWKDRLTPRFYSRLMSVMFPEDSHDVSFLSFYTIYKNLAEPETKIMYRALTVCHIATIHEPPFNYEQAYEYPKAMYKAIKDYVCDVITSYLHAIIHFNMKEAYAWLELRASNTLIDGNLVASYMLKDLETHKNEVSIESLEIWLEKNEMYFTVSEQLFLYLFGVNSYRDVKPLIPLPIVQTGRSTKTLLALPDVLLLNSKLPRRAQRWTLAYMLDSRSQNWETLRNAIYGKGQTIIVIQDSNGDIFGMYGSQRWFPSEGFFGNDGCFLFTLKPDVNIYDGSGKDNNFQLFTESGIGMGGSEEDPGMFINWSLRVGTTASRCLTFNKFSSISRDLVFDIRILELWVVKEVFMKRRNIPKRDFYNTVVMWNKIGKHKAKEGNKRTDLTDCWFPEEINSLRSENQCSHGEVLETEERHFETSNPSLTGTKNIDDELLIAIKNRLAGVPPLPGSVSLKPTGQQLINRELPITKPHYVLAKSSKSQKGPTQVSSTQVDDSMITELQNKATSTSHVKLNSKFTQSSLHGLAMQLEETSQLQHSTRRMQHIDSEFQRALPVGHNAQMGYPSNRIHHLDKQYEQTLQTRHSPDGFLYLDERYQQPPQPRQNSFSNQTRQSSQSPATISPSTNSRQGDGVTGDMAHGDRNSLSLPGVPDYYGSQRSSLSRSIRNSTEDESHNQQIHELSWTHRRNMGNNLPHQQQLVRAAPYDGNQYAQHGDNDVRHIDMQEDPNLKPTGLIKNTQREVSRGEVNRKKSKTDFSLGRDVPREAVRERSPNSLKTKPKDAIPEPSIQQHESKTSRKSFLHHLSAAPPSRDVYYNPLARISGSNQDHNLWVGDRASLSVSPSLSPLGSSSPSPEGQRTVLAMTRVKSDQMCRCGSRELNIVCQCKKEVEVIQIGRECRCPTNPVCYEDVPVQRKNKLSIISTKSQKGEARRLKAEKKRRKAEEKRRRKSEEKRRKCEKQRLKRERQREKREQKAREKEERKACRRLSKISKGRRMNTKNENCGMCVCCKCRGEQVTVVNFPSETCIENYKKAPKKEKKQKIKKPKEKKKKGAKEGLSPSPCRSNPRPILTEICPTPSFRPCECSQTQIPVLVPVERCVSQEITQPAIQGFCNHPDVPCPGVANPCSSRILNEVTGMNCGDPCCPYGKVQRCETVVPKARVCVDELGPTKSFQGCCCPESGGRAATVCAPRVCYVTNPAMVEQQPNSADLHMTNLCRNSASCQFLPCQSNPRHSNRGSVASDGLRYRDITAAPAIISHDEMGHGDPPEPLSHSFRSPTNPHYTPLPPEFSNDKYLIDLSKRCRENGSNRRYVPPCVLYLDCTKVKDLCVIIKDKYE